MPLVPSYAATTNPMGAYSAQSMPSSLSSFNPWAALSGQGGTASYSPTQFADSYNLENTTQNGGYEGYYSLGSQVQNPYQNSIDQGESSLAGYENTATAQLPGMNANVNAGNQNISNYANQSSAYPSYANSAGAGSQTADAAGLQTAASGPTSGSAYGLTPWSLMGEANSRNAGH